MLKPSVGSMVLMSSPLNFLTIVVLPALSRPLRFEEAGTRNGAVANRVILDLSSRQMKAGVLYMPERATQLRNLGSMFNMIFCVSPDRIMSQVLVER